MSSSQPSRCWRWLLLVASLSLWVAVMVAAAAAAPLQTRPHTRALSVSPHDTHTNVATVSRGAMQCDFSYSARKATPPPPSDKKSSTSKSELSVGMREAVARVKGICVAGTFGWWQYEACVGSTIQQFSPDQRDRYLLGTFEDIPSEGPSMQHYSKGDDCQGNPREAKLEIVCSSSGINQLVSVEEPEMCKYFVVLGLTSVCNIPGFRSVMKSTSHSPGSNRGMFDDWLVQVNKLSDGSFECSATLASAGDHPVAAPLLQASLQMTSLNDKEVWEILEASVGERNDLPGSSQSPDTMTVSYVQEDTKSSPLDSIRLRIMRVDQ